MNSFYAAGKGYYGVRVVTGKMCAGGSTRAACEYVQLIGSKGASAKVYLTGYFTDIDAGTYQDLTVETKESLGDIQVVTLGIDKNTWITNAWFAEYSVVYDLSFEADKTEKRFPCYHWINQDQSVTSTSKTSEC